MCMCYIVCVASCFCAVDLSCSTQLYGLHTRTTLQHSIEALCMTYQGSHTRLAVFFTGAKHIYRSSTQICTTVSTTSMHQDDLGLTSHNKVCVTSRFHGRFIYCSRSLIICNNSCTHFTRVQN